MMSEINIDDSQAYFSCFNFREIENVMMIEAKLRGVECLGNSAARR